MQDEDDNLEGKKSPGKARSSRRRGSTPVRRGATESTARRPSPAHRGRVTKAKAAEADVDYPDGYKDPALFFPFTNEHVSSATPIDVAFFGLFAVLALEAAQEQPLGFEEISSTAEWFVRWVLRLELVIVHGASALP